MTAKRWSLGACVLLLLLPAAEAAEEPAVLPLSRIVVAVEVAETAELARLDAAIAAATDQAEVLGLQRCAAFVKLAGRLAVCEGGLALAAESADKAKLADLATDLRDRAVRLGRTLPAGYEYDPLAALQAEVSPCAE